MKRYLLVGLMLLCAVYVAAQPLGAPAEVLPSLVREVRIAQTEIPLLQRLETAVAESCQHAHEAQLISHIPSAVLLPGTELSEPLQLDVSTVYPQLPSPDPQLVSKYFLVRNNMAVRRYVLRSAIKERQITARLGEFVSQKIPVTHAPEQDVAWLAEKLPENTQTLLVGEQHFYPEVQQQVMSLLTQLRARFAQRKIIVFTEFLPQGKVWGKSVTQMTDATYRHIWQHAQTLHIPVVGLEPEFVLHNKRVCVLGQDTEHSQNVLVSAEGLRLRNTEWKSVLSAYRQRYPDALFVVYGGAIHIEGTEPYALSHLWKNEQVFTAVFYPQLPNRSNLFEIWTHGLFDKQRVLFFENPELVELAGFNVRIQVPLTEQVIFR